MNKLVFICSLLLISGIANAEMVLNNAIGNDPDKEKLCANRAMKTMPGKIVPFEIDSDYVDSSRKYHKDATFIAIDNGSSPQLVECFLRDGTGRFEPDNMSPDEQRYWHSIKPKRFKPGINTSEGREMAAKVCMKSVETTLSRNDFDHIVYNSVIEVPLSATGKSIRAGTVIGGKKAERYDIVVKGTSFYKSSRPDLTAVNFTCLLSPMLDVKAMQSK